MKETRKDIRKTKPSFKTKTKVACHFLQVGGITSNENHDVGHQNRHQKQKTERPNYTSFTTYYLQMRHHRVNVVPPDSIL